METDVIVAPETPNMTAEQPEQPVQRQFTPAEMAIRNQTTCARCRYRNPPEQPLMMAVPVGNGKILKANQRQVVLISICGNPYSPYFQVLTTVLHWCEGFQPAPEVEIVSPTLKIAGKMG